MAKKKGAKKENVPEKQEAITTEETSAETVPQRVAYDAEFNH